jgi:hypothetical protein
MAEGYFLEPAAVKAYLALWGTTASMAAHKAQPAAPYSRGVMEAQAAQLSNLVRELSCSYVAPGQLDRG